MSEKILLFGRSYRQYGDSDADVIIKTKGLVKIQWGSKFIDLIKDGKIAVDSSFIFKVQDVSKIGVKDGIYVVGDSIYLKVGDATINLVGEIGTTFVSFMEGQETDAEAKYNAMVNIGFLYKSLEEVGSKSLLNGVIFVESELKLYIVKDGQLTEFKISIPNPFTEQFIIQKSDSSKGALVIKGTGSANSVAFDTFWIYDEYDNCIIDASNSVIIKSGGAEKVVVSESLVKVGVDLSANMIKSESATADSGFRLYYINGQSVLEVDKVIERGSQYGDDEEGSIIVYPEYWLLNNWVIKEAVPHSDNDEEDDEDLGNHDPTNKLDITLFLESTYKVGDILCAYRLSDVEEDTGEVDEEGEKITNTRSSYARVELEVTDVLDEGKTILVICSEVLDEDTIRNFSGRFIFLIKSPDKKSPIRLKDNNIDIVEYGDLSESGRSETIKTRIGDLSGIKDGETPLEGEGIYTNRLRLGGTEEDDFPKYTETLNGIVSTVNIKDSDSYDCVLVSVGLLKQILKEDLDTIKELKEKIEALEEEVSKLKDPPTS